MVSQHTARSHSLYRVKMNCVLRIGRQKNRVKRGLTTKTVVSGYAIGLFLLVRRFIIVWIPEFYTDSSWIGYNMWKNLLQTAVCGLSF